MARIAGVNIRNQKRVPIALTYIHGIGRSKATEISLLAPPNLPFGEDQDSSGISLILILRMPFGLKQE